MRVETVFVVLAALCTACTGNIGGPVVNGGGEAGSGGQSGGTSGKREPEGVSELKSGPKFARLTHFQWQNSVRALLRLPSLPTTGLSLQDDAVQGFDNNNAGTALDVSFDLRIGYERGAETLAQLVAKDDSAIARLVPAGAPTALEAKARAVIRSLGERAYRRPMQQSEVDELWALFKAAPSLVTNSDPFKAGLEVVIGAMLQSPFFLYRVELGEGDGDKKEGFDLTPFEFATRLAFALTDTMPDDELLEAARSNRLSTEEQIKAQAERLLKTPAAAASASHFHEQLFRFAKFDGIQRDTMAYPEFTADVSPMLKEEARLFLDDIMQTGKPASAILTSSETFVNSKLAGIYGLSGNFGSTFRKAGLDANKRRGILSQLGFLAAYSGPRDPDPIHRGVFISEVILCKTLPSPVEMVPAVPPDPVKTNRERIESHTGKGTCGDACHKLINPLGYAFESFDAVGKYRTMDNGVRVDTAMEYAGLNEGEIKVRDAVELSTKMAESPDFHACYLANWSQYLWSRSELPEDPDALADLAKQSQEGRSVREMLLSLVTTPSFRRYVP